MNVDNKNLVFDFAFVSSIVRYDLVTGNMFWKPRIPSMFKAERISLERACSSWNKRLAGKEAATYLDDGGYKQIRIAGKTMLAHRVAWLLATGDWPSEQIDHINGIRSDNRFENLRCVSNSENHKNRKKPMTNTTGVVGVYWFKEKNKWHAQINVGGKKHNFGFFDDFDAAVAARKRAEEVFGFHENHGRSN